MRLNKQLAASLLAVGLTVTIRCAAQISGPGAAVKIDYARDVRPIFMEKCYVCHGPVQQLGRLRLDIKQDRTAVAAGGAKSELIRRVTSQDPSTRMPPWPTALGITPNEIEILKNWAADGATGVDPAPTEARTACWWRSMRRTQAAFAPC